MRHLLFILFVGAFFISCSKDNYDAPEFILQGAITYNNDSIQVRSNGVQLELWQPGYQLFTKIPIHVNQNGYYSVSLFKGNYQLITLRDNGPWANMVDTININVDGNMVYDLDLIPNFNIINTAFNFTKEDSTVTSTFQIQNSGNKTIEFISLYISTTDIVDNVNNTYSLNRPVTNEDLTNSFTMSLVLNQNQINGDPAKLRLYNVMKNNGYCFARVGVKTAGVQEMNFSKIVKLTF